MSDGWTRTDNLKAQWAAKMLEESDRERTTARALHYLALERTVYLLFNRASKMGTPKYLGSDADNLTEWLAQAKSQGLIDWDRVPDESVGECCVSQPKNIESDLEYRVLLH